VIISGTSLGVRFDSVKPQCDWSNKVLAWCDAHHLRHWADGGPTDLSNGTLLCPRHHTIVHRHRLNATLTPTGVHWDQRPGSYDHALARAPTPGGSDP
jgi:hypothetical protein